MRYTTSQSAVIEWASAQRERLAVERDDPNAAGLRECLQAARGPGCGLSPSQQKLTAARRRALPLSRTRPPQPHRAETELCAETGRSRFALHHAPRRTVGCRQRTSVGILGCAAAASAASRTNPGPSDHSAELLAVIDDRVFHRVKRGLAQSVLPVEVLPRRRTVDCERFGELGPYG